MGFFEMIVKVGLKLLHFPNLGKLIEERHYSVLLITSKKFCWTGITISIYVFDFLHVL